VLWTLFGDPALRVRHRILTGVEERPTPAARRPTLAVTPNPCRSSATIRITGSSFDVDRSSFSIYDASGRAVFSQPVRNSSFVIRTSSLASGVYVIELSCLPGTPLRQKLVVR
jgi:hypothetical protein